MVRVYMGWYHSYSTKGLRTLQNSTLQYKQNDSHIYTFYLFIWLCQPAARRLRSCGTHVGSYFPNQGSDLCPLRYRQVLNHWMIKDVPLCIVVY